MPRYAALLLSTVALPLWMTACGGSGERAYSIAEIRDSAYVWIRLFGRDGEPTSLVAYLDYPNNQSSTLPDGRCWTSEIEATIDGMPLDAVYRGATVWVGSPGTPTCWGGVYLRDLKLEPYSGTVETEIRFFDSTGEIVVRTRGMFVDPSLMLEGPLVAGQRAVVHVSPSTVVLGRTFVFRFRGSENGTFFLTEQTPGVERTATTVAFDVPTDVPAQTGTLSAETDDTGGAPWVEVIECTGAKWCAAIRSAEATWILTHPLGADPGFGPPMEIPVTLEAP